jgi:membrane dipeptidase
MAVPSIDLHVDTLTAVVHEGRRLELPHEESAIGLPPRQFDVPKMQIAGLDAAVFAIFVTPYWEGERAAERAHWLIDALDLELARRPVAAGLRRVRTTVELSNAIRDNARGAFIGIEGGHAIADSLERLREFALRGVRYMTLTWANANNWADSSGSSPVHGGLTAFGRRVVHEMELQGVLIDISHVADSTFWDVVTCASLPFIASHSGCFALCPHPRNLRDEQLRAVAESGGVVGIPFHSDFLQAGPTWQTWVAPWRSGGPFPDPAAAEFADRRDRPPISVRPVSLQRLVSHILHAIDVAGVDHVAIGSDYDGMMVPPRGLADVSGLPLLRAALIEAGVQPDELDAVYGGNVLRVFQQAEKRLPTQ